LNQNSRINSEILSAHLGLILLMVAMVIQNGIMEMMNIRVKVPAVIKNNQMKNPSVCADVTISII
jgi:hypothetical protein